MVGNQLNGLGIEFVCVCVLYLIEHPILILLTINFIVEESQI